MTWAGDSLWRRFVAWLGQTAILAALLAVGVAIMWFLIMPMVTNNLVQTIQNAGQR